MDDYENPRVRRLRGAAFRHAATTPPDVTSGILRTTRFEVARVKVAAEAEGKDFLKALVAKVMQTDYDSITQAQTDEAHEALVRYKMLGELEAIAKRIPQKRGVAEFLHEELLKETLRKP